LMVEEKQRVKKKKTWCRKTTVHPGGPKISCAVDKKVGGGVLFSWTI